MSTVHTDEPSPEHGSGTGEKLKGVAEVVHGVFTEIGGLQRGVGDLGAKDDYCEQRDGGGVLKGQAERAVGMDRLRGTNKTGFRDTTRCD